MIRKKISFLLIGVLLITSINPVKIFALTSDTTKSVPINQGINYDFEKGQDLTDLNSLNTSNFSVVKNGDSNALLVDTSTTQAEFSGVSIDAEELISLGDNPSLSFQISNPTNLTSQVRVDIIDNEASLNPIDQVVRTYYYTLSSSQSRTIMIDNFASGEGTWNGPDGWWGDNNGVDTSAIDAINIYLWEKNPTGCGHQFLIDNIKSANCTAYTNHLYVSLDQTKVEINMSKEKTYQLNAFINSTECNDNILWTSSDITIATVDSTGLITALKPGIVTINATSIENNSLYASCLLHITDTDDTSPIIPEESTSVDAIFYDFEPGQVDMDIESFNEANYTVKSNNDSKALYVDTSESTSEFSGVRINPEGFFSLGKEPSISFALTNAEAITSQIRIDFVDKNTTTNPIDQNIRTYYYLLNGNETRNITVDNFSATEGSFTGNDGWWGCPLGVDTDNLDYVNIYLWKNRPGGSSKSFFVDNLKSSNSSPSTNHTIIDLNETSIKLDSASNKTFQLTALINNSPANRDVTWVSNNPNIASVSEEGLVTAVSEGVTTITASSLKNPLLQKSCNVQVVVKKKPITLSVSPDTLIFSSSDQVTATIKASIQPEVDNMNIIWKSSNSKIATVDKNGTVTAHANGKCMITATPEYDKTKAASTSIEVSCFEEPEVTTPNYMKRISLEDGESSAEIIPNEVTTRTLSGDGNTDGEKSLSITFNSSTATLDFVPTIQKSWILDDDSCLTFSAKNYSSNSQELFITLLLEDKDTGLLTEQVNKATISADQLSKFTTAYGMPATNTKLEVGIPNIGFESGDNVLFPTGHCNILPTTLVSGPKEINNCNLNKISFHMKAGGSIILDNLKVYNDASKIALANYYYLDEYGQSNNIEPSERTIETDEQLIASDEKEQTQLDKWIEESKLDDSRDQFGGWRNEELKQEAKGKFYTTKIDGQWVMIDPEGYPYLSTGIDIIRLGDHNTYLSGRETMFENLPNRYGKYEEHFCSLAGNVKEPKGNTTGLGINYYSLNLERKYGEEWLDKWTQNTIKRMKAWGFTGLGNWSDPDISYGKGSENKTAYAANFWINAPSIQKLNVDGWGWGMLYDPFDPNFTRECYNQAVTLKEYGVDRDPWCIGVFVDNEIHWGQTKKEFLVESLFWSNDCNSAPAYAKNAAINWLREYYGSIDKLNTDWKTDYQDFEDLYPSNKIWIRDMVPLKVQHMIFDLIFEQYYKTVSEQVHRVLPNTMYLGSRFANWGLPTDCVEIAAKYCDIVSFNSYQRTPIQSWMQLDRFDKPILIGEFHFNSRENGALTPGLVPTYSKDTRQADVENYYAEMTKNNKLVGIHWFQYYDEPILGRAWDGELSDTGFVDVTDQPYDSLVNAARNFNGSMYEKKFSSSKVTITSKPSNDPVIPLKPDSETPDAPAVTTEDVQPYTGMTFEGNDGIQIYSLGDNTNSSTEIVTGKGVTEGTHALRFKITKLDRSTNKSIYKTLYIKTQKVFTLNMGKGISLDVTNPTTTPIQLRIIPSYDSCTPIMYYWIQPSETRTIILDKQGPEDNYIPSGYNDGWYDFKKQIDYSKLNSLSICIWEGADELSNSSSAELIFDNIQGIFTDN